MTRAAKQWLALAAAGALGAALLPPVAAGVRLAAAPPAPQGIDAEATASFREGIAALDRGDYAAAAVHLRDAIRRQSEGRAEAVRIYGNRSAPYLPHYFLGLALRGAGDAAGAAAAFAAAAADGTIGQFPDLAAEMARQGGTLAPSSAAPDVAASPPAAGATAPAPSGPPTAAAAPAFLTGQFVGPVPCAAANCHGNPEPSGVYAVLQNEFATWKGRDPHSRAFDVLFNDVARRIARNLRLAEEAPRSAACLACHVLNVPRPAQGVPLEPEDGISCEACHGPAGGWLARHNEAGWSRQDSLAAGMIDLASPRRRAALCLTCHLGGPQAQVGHELIAAGHPELVFELDNYSEAMPPHWPPRGDGGARAWAVGQAYAFRESLLQLARRTASPAWPEFAEMSCDACHHSLADGAWRQERGYRHRPGTPSWSPARWAVLRHVIALAAPAEQAALDPAVARLATAVADLGAARSEVRALAEQAAAALAPALPAIERASWTGADIRALLGRLAADRDFLLGADRQSAEQMALAAQSLVAALAARESGARRALQSEVDELFAVLEDPYRFDAPRFAEGLQRLAPGGK